MVSLSNSTRTSHKGKQVPAATNDTDKAKKNEILNKLAELAGQDAKRTDAIQRVPGKWNVPPEVGSLKDAAKYLLEAWKAGEEPTEVIRQFEFRPWDGAHAAAKVMEKIFGGTVALKSKGMFGPEPPRTISVNVGPGRTVQVPWGDFSLAQFPESRFSFSATNHSRFGQVFQIVVTCPKKLEPAVQGFFALVDEECAQNSIYRGQAFIGDAASYDTEFVDLSGFKSESVVYSGDAYKQLDANVWTLVEQTERALALGQSLKRAVCVHGPYGTGKTLFTKETAKRCVENGWTFLISKPGDDLGQIMQTARLYEPAVVVFEDIDTIAKADQDEQTISALLDVFDGLNAKDTKVITILTTNHPDKLHKGMLRPGRLDAMIEIAALDKAGIQKLIEVTVGNRLVPGFDFAPVIDAMEGFLPSFIVETCNIATKYAMARTKGEHSGDIMLDAEDLVYAAGEKRPQHDRMEAALDNVHVPNLTDKLSDVVAETVARVVTERIANSIREDIVVGDAAVVAAETA